MCAWNVYLGVSAHVICADVCVSVCLDVLCACVCRYFPFRFKGFSHCNVSAKWIQGSFGDAQETLAKT